MLSSPGLRHGTREVYPEARKPSFVGKLLLRARRKQLELELESRCMALELGVPDLVTQQVQYRDGARAFCGTCVLMEGTISPVGYPAGEQGWESCLPCGEKDLHQQSFKRAPSFQRSELAVALLPHPVRMKTY